MTDAGFGVHPDEMRAHAKKVTAVSDRLATALDAARTTTLHIGAFGLIGQFLVPAVVTIEGVATAAIGASDLAVDGTALGIRAMADAYDRVEDANEKMFGGAA